MTGISLIEALIALAIFSITILGCSLLSLQGLKVTRQSLHETHHLFHIIQ